MFIRSEKLNGEREEETGIAKDVCECERRLTLGIQAGGRDYDTCIRTCDEKDVEVPPIVLYWLNMLWEWGCTHKWDWGCVRV